MISTIQDDQTKQKLSEKPKNIFTLSLFAASMVSLVPATASGKNHQPPPGSFDDSGIQQSTMMNTSLRELFPRFLSAVLALFLFSGNLFADNNGLVAAYGFEDEEIRGTTVADASGNGNHGTIKEAVRIDAGIVERH